MINQWISEANEDEWDLMLGHYWYYYGKDGTQVVSNGRRLTEKTTIYEEGHMQTDAGVRRRTILGEEGTAHENGWIELENENDEWIRIRMAFL